MGASCRWARSPELGGRTWEAEAGSPEAGSPELGLGGWGWVIEAGRLGLAEVRNPGGRLFF